MHSVYTAKKRKIETWCKFFLRFDRQSPVHQFHQKLPVTPAKEENTAINTHMIWAEMNNG